jgi:deazaflavin-dependent oxidoreductase (nitroreductase family)
MVRDRARVLNKYVTNRVLRGLAHLPRGPFALVRHVGRRSGQRYETVIMVFPTEEGFVIALTYGPNVDWLRNLQAARGGTVLWHGKEYVVGKPEPIVASAALPLFPRFFRLVLGRSGLRDFARVTAVRESPPKKGHERAESG